MTLIKFALVYRDHDGTDHTDRSVTVEAQTINAGIRKAVTQATAAGSHPAGWQLVSVRWEPLV